MKREPFASTDKLQEVITNNSEKGNINYIVNDIQTYTQTDEEAEIDNSIINYCKTMAEAGNKVSDQVRIQFKQYSLLIESYKELFDSYTKQVVLNSLLNNPMSFIEEKNKVVEVTVPSKVLKEMEQSIGKTNPSQNNNLQNNDSIMLNLFDKSCNHYDNMINVINKLNNECILLNLQHIELFAEYTKLVDINKKLNLIYNNNQNQEQHKR